jgi:hypothetical protein
MIILRVFRGKPLEGKQVLNEGLPTIFVKKMFGFYPSYP